jgi:anthranilate phosphoribosyltransferase
LKGGTAEDNARAIRDLFSGAKGAFRGIVLLNAAAALIAAGQATNLKDGVAQAAEAIDKGRAAAALEQARQQRNA